jgi:hypothetical protein
MKGRPTSPVIRYRHFPDVRESGIFIAKSICEGLGGAGLALHPRQRHAL